MTTKPPKDPFVAARDEHNAYIRGGIITRTTWQVIAVLGFVGGFSGIGFASAQAKAPTYDAYYVEFDANGNPNFTGILAAPTDTLNDATARHILKSFIERLHSVSSDPVVNRLNHFNLGYMVTEAGRNQAKAYLESYNTDQMVATHITVDLQFDFYTHLGDATWLVHWTDIVGQGGVTSKRVPMVGQFAFVTSGKLDSQAGEDHPWTSYISSFSIQEAAN